MYQLTAVYRHPADPQQFVDHYRNHHAVLASQLPDLRSYVWHLCESLDGSAPPFFLAAVVQWENKAVAIASLESDAGQRAIADLTNFADAGCEMQFGEVAVAVPDAERALP